MTIHPPSSRHKMTFHPATTSADSASDDSTTPISPTIPSNSISSAPLSNHNLTKASTDEGIIDLLILGAGWTSQFLFPILSSLQHPGGNESWSYQYTTRDGRGDSIKFTFDHRRLQSLPESEQREIWSVLPAARYVLVTFPLDGVDAARELLRGSRKFVVDRAETISSSMDERRQEEGTKWVVLGSTGIWQHISTHACSNGNGESEDLGGQKKKEKDGSDVWITRHTPPCKDTVDSNPRYQAEEYLLSLQTCHDEEKQNDCKDQVCVLSLAGLWDGVTRDPKNFVERIIKTKQDVKGKKSLHLIHGVDVARGIVAVINRWDDYSTHRNKLSNNDDCTGQRYMLTDGIVYDWWTMLLSWADDDGKEEDGTRKKRSTPSCKATWVYELMNEENVRALPRSMEVLGRCYDSREFWSTFHIVPLKAGAL